MDFDQFNTPTLQARGVRVLLLKPEDTDQLGKQYQQLREEFLLGRRS